MSRAGGLPYLARAGSLLALGALGVHQLRYLVAYGPHGGEALHREGHAYLEAALPIVVALAAAGIVAGLLRVALAGPGGRAANPAAPRRALLYAAGLLAVFTAQELAEGVLAPGHPAGLAAIVGGGAWVAAPLAMAFGALAALAERLLARADVVLGSLAVGPGPKPGPDGAPSIPSPALRRAPLASSPMAFGVARRPPPAPRYA